MTQAFPLKDPAAVLPYEIDWAPWLGEGITISGEPVVEASGADVNPEEHATEVVNGTKVRFWLGGGAAESFCNVSCQITASDGRTDRRTFLLRIAAH